MIQEQQTNKQKVGMSFPNVWVHLDGSAGQSRTRRIGIVLVLLTESVLSRVPIRSRSSQSVLIRDTFSHQCASLLVF